MTVSYATLYLPGSSQGIQVVEGSQLHLIYVAMGANSVPSAPGETVRQDPYPQYVDADELSAALAGLGGGNGGAVDSVNGQTGVVVLDADDIADSTTRKIMTSDERDKLAGIPDNGAAPTLANIPAGSTLTVQKSGSTWPARPTARTDVFVQWKGADPSPAIVSSGTGGMRDGIDTRFVTP